MPITLSKTEKIVLNVVQEYLDKNRQFNIEKILPFINSRFRMAKININTNGIEINLKSLVKKNLIIEGSKLSKADVLLNSKREGIYRFVHYNPGTYFNRILNELHLSNHVVVWHLNILLKFGFIVKERIEKHDIYYETGTEPNYAKKIYVSSKEKSKQILKYLRKNSTGITKTRLSNELSIHPNTITKYLKDLEQYNIVNKEILNNKTLYYINEENLDILI